METKKTDLDQPERENEVAFLVVDGARVVILDKPVVNVGRKSDNHIVIDDQHVSRYHAQIREYKGKYVLLDLNSTVGTSVNGEKIDQAALNPGDVISLGGVPIIFGRGAPRDWFEGADSITDKSGNSSPTLKTGMHSADRYLDLFKTSDDEQ